MPDHAFPEESAQSVLLTLAHLKKRGWTPALITRFLPEPDSIKQNPYYRRGAPMRLYQQARVEAIEATPEFREAQQRAAPAFHQRKGQCPTSCGSTHRTSQGHSDYGAPCSLGPTPARRDSGV
ncbi:MAG: hypothetical protein KatS3mg057_1375 [Herpetosiphonaceae bacterium]|nr:MAG: hypothetical protein KatS3mg057_1375 [Herpetosiphonaceae bacterium]